MSDGRDHTEVGDAADYAGPERRQEYLQWRKEVDRRLDDGAATMKGLREDIAANTTVTKSVQTDTSELVALLQSAKGHSRSWKLWADLPSHWDTSLR